MKYLRNKLFLWAVVMLIGALGSEFITIYFAMAAYAVWLVLFILDVHIDAHKAFEKYSLEFAKRQNLKLLRISPSKSARFKPGKLICCPPVGEFLWYIENAKYFLTDSFHGTAFAINLNTPFIDILPNKFSERNRSILSLVGLEHRILDNLQDFSLAEIAENMDISRQGVRDFIKRGEIQLKEFEAALGLLKRFSEINAELDTIKTGLAELKKLPLPQKADSLVA